MAKVAKSGTFPSNSLPFGGGTMKFGAGLKRKTPSELRGEQLKQINVIEIIDESPAPLLDPMKPCSELTRGLKQSDPIPRYIDTRMDALFPVRKSRFRMESGKLNIKGTFSTLKITSTHTALDPAALPERSQLPHPCAEDSMASAAVAKGDNVEACQTTKSNQNSFRSVADLSIGNELLSTTAILDMGKALKGFAAHKPPSLTHSPTESSAILENLTSTHSSDFCGECIIPGKKTPLDLTLKTYMRVVSSSSVDWFHRSLMSGTYNGLSEPSFQNFSSENKNFGTSSGPTVPSLAFNSKALHSWVYPQSSLPPSVISALTLSAADDAEMDFLRKRQLAWEDSFRCLYYMFRKNVCDIFYVCTTRFVVLFTACDDLRRVKRPCSAYVSQSTRGLRSLLKENDISFSMPLCRSKVEEITTEDLVELSEIEKHNLGQTRRLSSMSDVDNSSQSLLAFDGNKNVHGLFDFLLNYRSFLSFLTGVDVPQLYSPVPFQNASLSAPKISCKELKKVDHIAFPLKGSNAKDNDSKQDSSSGLCYSIEIKDAYLPPWIISTICATMGSEGRSFEATFMTEPTTSGLNVALENVCQKSGPQSEVCENLKESGLTFGIQDVIATPNLYSALLKGLKYCDNTYIASLSPV